jgi:signal transduction histidine kinase
VSSILVLDDRATERELLVTILGYMGHAMVEAPTGQTALDLARKHPPDLIMVDLMMPGMNGYEFVRELRADPELRNTRVVFCTATYDQLEVRGLAENCGVHHILVKPCEPEEVIRVVGEALGADQSFGPPVLREELDREALRVMNAKLMQKLDELELSQRAIGAKAEELATSLKYKSEFLANMSHELRTPLNSVLIFAGLLRDDPEQNLTPKQVQYAGVIHSAGTDLLRLITDILDLAEVEAGAVVMEVAELALADLTDALRREFGHIADRRRLTFSIELSGRLPATITTDPARLHQVLTHLLANAFKFTERGGVSVGVHPANDGAMVDFSISDTGIGMTADTQRRIFDDFVQGDGTAARHYGGTGLGLSSSRALADLLGGEITVTSTPACGSTFTMRVPVTEPSAARPPSTGVKALVVDDDYRNILAFTALLERAGFEVISAENGTEGVALLQRMPDIAIALVDVMMPVMDGYATIAAMRKLPAGGNVPILAVTAKVGAGEAERCIAAGASAYVSKPVDTAALMRVIAEWLPHACPAGAAGRAA